MKLHNILVYQEETDNENQTIDVNGLKELNNYKTVPVFYDFNYTKHLGFAKLKILNGKIFADFELNSDYNLCLTPAIGFKCNKIYSIGLCASDNVDHNILSLKEQLC